MKIIYIIIAIILLLGITTSPVNAATFSDNFDDGNADGWWLGYSLSFPSHNGNWRVENGELVQDTGYDGVIALVENQQFSDQTIETQLKVNGPSGGDGVLMWYKDDNNLVFVGVSGGAVGVSENNEGVWTGYSYDLTSFTFDTWYNLKVVVDSVNGNLDVYLDNSYLFTYPVSTLNRFGQSGVMNGNAGGYFDNFSITTPPTIEPLSDKDQCKNDGWIIFNNPLFKNQGDCVSFLEKNK